ncbi:LADA_0E00342g1_1 [Lachancea dasiensis]|uniref:LADA_0E00342g1_1 n=1 Tax=Lachancea dasiensis TaxID=1072105 RepID=A0A1G4J9W8_9SACH|nr:LADA_0E00342g1_1 [Lachancea dasiensis]
MRPSNSGILTKNKRRRGKVPENERLRKAVACTECQRQKSKCVGGFPCERCVAKNITCKSVPQVRISQQALLDREERLSCMESIIKVAFPGIETSLEQMRLKLGELNGDKKAREMIKHIDLRNVQRIDGGKTHTFYEDVGSTSSFVVRASEIVSHGASASALSNSKPAYILPGERIGSISSESSAVLSNLLSFALSSLPPLEHAQRLLNTFISVAGNNTFFYFDSRWYRKIFSRIYTTKPNIGLTDVNNVCLLYMGLCMGSIFAYVWKSREIIMVEGERTFPGATYYEHAQLLFPAVINDSSLETVQVFFMASMYVLAGQELEMAYTYLGIAMRAAVANGMHKSFPGGSDFDEKKAESRKRLFWSVYTIERRSAIALGRPETLPVSDIDLDLPVFCKSLDDNAENADVICMTLIITVSLLTIKIHDMWFRRGKNGLKFATIMDLYHKIERWRGQVPPRFEVRSMCIEQRSYRGAAHVNFAYNLARITLGRPFLLLKLRNTNVSTSIDEGLNSFATQMVQYSYHAASQIVGILLTLRSNNLLSCYSFNDYNACHVASFVLVVYLALCPSTEALQMLNDSVSILQQISQSSKFTQKSTNVILKLKETVEQRQTHQRWIDGAILGIGNRIDDENFSATMAGKKEKLQDTWGQMDASLDALTDEQWFLSLFCEGSLPLNPDHCLDYLFQDHAER